uniref:Uncharacterized protein n=1 Tax=Eutreptiella gymnastica TaxID=73025 RepID=A0A7S4GC21_9EUGL|mmetsp:Transcript_13437/g.21292  ORF Transcript_13437/g.21292 Transcript_13437/m.21292 type:complete len:137 (+) Transcript_13437:283-693(+)
MARHTCSVGKGQLERAGRLGAVPSDLEGRPARRLHDSPGILCAAAQLSRLRLPSFELKCGNLEEFANGERSRALQLINGKNESGSCRHRRVNDKCGKGRTMRLFGCHSPFSCLLGHSFVGPVSEHVGETCVPQCLT